MENQSILIACRDREPLKNIIKAIALNHKVTLHQDGAAALESILLDMPRIALIDIDLPGMNATELARRVHRSMSHSLPTLVLFGRKGDVRLSAMITHGFAQGFIELPSSDGAFLERFWNIVDSRLRASWAGLNEVQRALLEAGSECVDMMARTAAADEPVDADLVNTFCSSVVAAGRSDNLLGLLGTLRAHLDVAFTHCLKVSATMTVFGLGLGLRETDLVDLAQSGLLHDIGKITISPDLLLKPTPLADQERRIFEAHPRASVDVLRRSEDFDETVIRIAENHHERLDGSGYPRALKGGQIDDPSLLAAIADRFATLTEGGPMQRRMTAEEAVAAMKQEAKGGLEPHFFMKFAEMVGDGLIL
ncbi:MAG: HD domain-containing protein [Rhodospirillales bacterium]|nr:HD domain-containing protein [Rhodospirillales bacterium]